MPCYLFTYHGYGTWMPDRKQGFVKRKATVLASDSMMDRNYRRKQSQSTVSLDARKQQSIIENVLDACSLITTRCHAIATDNTHVHILVSWKTERKYASISKALKSRITKALNAKFGNRIWLSKGSSRNRVTDLEHFDYLMRHYLPSHRGLGWYEKTGDA